MTPSNCDKFEVFLGKNERSDSIDFSKEERENVEISPAKPRNCYRKTRIFLNWLYGLMSMFLITTDFFRSSWIFQEAIGGWIPSRDGVLPLYSRPKLGPNLANAIDVVLKSTRKEKSMPKFRKIFTGRLFDADYEYYKTFQPHEEWSKEDNFAVFKEYTHDANGTLLPGVSSDNISYNSINYWEGFQVGYRRTMNTTTTIILDAMFYQSIARNLLDSNSAILHTAGGQFWDLGNAHGGGNVEIYHMEFYEINSKIYSNTSGVEGLLLEADVFIEIYAIHYIADAARLLAYIMIVYLAWQYSHLIKSPSRYNETICCPYDFIMGNRIIAILMGVAFLLDYEVSINVIFTTGWYAFFTWDIYYIYLTLVYAFRCFWLLNFIATIHGCFSFYINKRWFINAPISLKNGRMSLIFGASSIVSCGCICYLHTTSIISPYFDDLPDISFTSFLEETQKAGYDIQRYDLTSGQYCLTFLFAANFCLSLCIWLVKGVFCNDRCNTNQEEKDAFLHDLFIRGILTTTPTGSHNAIKLSDNNQPVDPHEFTANSEAQLFKKSEAIVSFSFLQIKRKKSQINSLQ